jgi:ribonuclease HI
MTLSTLAGLFIMVYPMEIYTDGGCRGNRRPGAIGAAAAVFKTKYGKYRGWIRVLPSYPPPTNQRAEITAIIVALEEALAKFRKLSRHQSTPRCPGLF